MSRLWALACCCALSSCAEDGDLLYVRAAVEQPDDPTFGRLLSVFASAGDRGDDAADTRLQILVSRGKLRSAEDPEPGDEICARVRKERLHEEQIVVVPDDSEALIHALLRENVAADDCSGIVRTAITVPVLRVGEQSRTASFSAGARRTESVLP